MLSTSENNKNTEIIFPLKFKKLFIKPLIPMNFDIYILHEKYLVY